MKSHLIYRSAAFLIIGIIQLISERKYKRSIPVVLFILFVLSGWVFFLLSSLCLNACRKVNAFHVKGATVLSPKQAREKDNRCARGSESNLTI